MLLLVVIFSNSNIQNTTAIPLVLESDILTTNGGTNFTVAYTRESDIWSANATNTFKLSIDVIEFGLDTISLNTVWFGYRFRNETTDFTYESWSSAIGRVSPLSPYWEDRVSLDPSKVDNPPSILKLTLALKFVENFVSKSDEEWSMMWSDVVIITLDPSATAIEITDPLPVIIVSYTETETITETVVTNDTIRQTWETPYFTTYPHDQVIDINQTNGKALPYNLTWVIQGTSDYGNWGNVTLDHNPLWVVEGAWNVGVPIVISGQGQGLVKGYHTYTLIAEDRRGFSITHEIYVNVVNMTGFAIDNPEIVASLSNEYGGASPNLPIPFSTYTMVFSIGVMIIITKMRNKLI